MKEEIHHDIIEALKHTIAENPQGMLLFIMGSIMITILHLIYRKEVVTGFKGDDLKWQHTEWILYLFSWLFPYILIGNSCRVMVSPDWVWYFLGFILIYGLMGSKGIQAILAWKNGSTGVPPTEEPKPQ